VAHRVGEGGGECAEGLVHRVASVVALEADLRIEGPRSCGGCKPVDIFRGKVRISA
jgi:hypothetical protein